MCVLCISVVKVVHRNPSFLLFRVNCPGKTCPPLQSLLGATPSHQMPDIESSAGNLTTLPQPCGAFVRLSCSDSSRKVVPPVPVVRCTSSGEWSVKKLGICLLKNGQFFQIPYAWPTLATVCIDTPRCRPACVADNVHPVLFQVARMYS